MVLGTEINAKKNKNQKLVAKEKEQKIPRSHELFEFSRCFTVVGMLRKTSVHNTLELLEMHTSGLCFRPTASATVGAGPGSLCCKKPSQCYSYTMFASLCSMKILTEG